MPLDNPNEKLTPMQWVFLGAILLIVIVIAVAILKMVYQNFWYVVLFAVLGGAAYFVIKSQKK